MLNLIGFKIPKDSPLMEKLKGAKEIDIVYSGLEEILSQATKENWEFALTRNINLRDACLANALTKLEQRFEQSGIMV